MEILHDVQLHWLIGPRRRRREEQPAPAPEDIVAKDAGGAAYYNRAVA